MDKKVESTLRISLTYLIVSVLWILFSDKLVLFIAQNENDLNIMQTYKGLFFVASTTFLIAIMVYRDMIVQEKIREELKKEKQKAEEANKAKSQFLSNMSHEIRTPMNGVIGTAELLSMSELNSEQRNLLDDMQISADNLLAIINDILDISKIESGRMELNIDKFNLYDMINKVLDMLSYNAHRKGLEVIYYPDKNLPKIVEGDENKTRQVLINLISNAIKYTDNGNIYFEVKKVEEKRNKNIIRFLVEDTGIGISESKKDMIFKPFIQGDLSYTKQYQGTGLGLSISKDLVNIMGGKIDFESEKNIGSKFFFSIGVEQVKSEEATNYIDKTKAKDITILFVDDNRLNRKIGQKILKEHNFNVELAESGEEALKKLKDGLEVNLILLDVNMPGMNGISVAEKIRDQFGYNFTILLFTSVDIHGDIDNLENIGVQGYLMKPIKRVKLIKKIEEVINKNQLNKKIKKITRDEIEKKNNLGKIKIMVAEDNRVSRRLMKRITKRIGNIEGIFVKNGEQAVELYKKEQPDIIFMDIQMPIMNGKEAFKEIKKYSELNNMDMPVVVAMTAYALDGDRNNFINIGMDEYIPKPFNNQEITEIIDKYRKF